MISSLQPTRPKVAQPTAQSNSPLSQQQTRSQFTQPPPRPRNQFEAMPPFPLPHVLPLSQPAFLQYPNLSGFPSASVRHTGPAQLPYSIPPNMNTVGAPQVFDPAKRHPVFFTERLKKPPSGVAAGGWCSPVAAGYVANGDGSGNGNGKADGRVKL